MLPTTTFTQRSPLRCHESNNIVRIRRQVDAPIESRWPMDPEEDTKANKHAVDAAEEEATSEEEEETIPCLTTRKN